MSSSSSPALGQNFRDIIKSRIRREYARLFEDFDWPHLQVWETRSVNAGQRYYDFPDTLTLGTTRAIYREHGNQWLEIARGLTPMDYNAFNSDDGVRTDPIQKWRPYGDNQIEVWPLPASASTLLFVGKRTPSALTDEDDTADLDSDLLILFAAGKLLKRRKADDADIVLAEANTHYTTLKQRAQTGEKVNFACRDEHPQQIGFQDKILVGIS